MGFYDATVIEISGFNLVANKIVTQTFTVRAFQELFVLDHFSISGTIRECGRFSTFEEAESKAHELIAKYGIIEK